MKKLIIGAAVAAMGLGAFATDALSSANCVGYMTKSITAGTFYMVAVQFENVGVSGFAALNDLLSLNGIEPSIYDEMESKAACINVRNGDFYTPYYYISDAYDADGNEVTGWANGGGDLVTAADLVLGGGFWFMAPVASESATITVAGQVTEGSSYTINVPAGTFAICANPFPVATDLSLITTTGIATSIYDEMESKAACINVRNGDFYTPYYYISDAYDADGNEVTGWANGGGDLVTGEAIPAGASFWINSPSAGALSFSL